MRPLVLLSVIPIALAMGCEVGDVGQDDPPEPGNDQYQIACEASLAITGSLTPAGAAPGPDDDCIPDGTWSLQVTIDDMGNCDNVPIHDSYVYVVSRDEENLAVMDYQGTDGNPELDRYQPGSAGQTCRANIEHYSDDTLKVVYLQPFEDELVITGSGTFELWEKIEVAP